MKKLLVYLFSGLLVFSLFSCGSGALDKLEDELEKEFATTDSAIDYNDEMIDIQSEADQAMADLYDEILIGDEESVVAAHEETIEILKDSKKKVEEMDDFAGNDDFKKALLELIDVFMEITENEFAEYIDFYYFMDDSELTDEEWDYYYNLTDVAFEKYDDAYNDFSEFQQSFADEHDFTLN